jgi:hypothetical protein
MMRAVALFRDMNADLPPEQVQKAIEHAAKEKLPEDEKSEDEAETETPTSEQADTKPRDDNITPLRDNTK